MIVLKSPIEINKRLNSFRERKNTIGFVPTMGALHKGHLSLIKRCKSENDITVCSIFVNPKQFNEAKDLDLYPRPIEKDIILLEQAGVDILFLPGNESIYPASYSQPFLNLNGLDNVMEGLARPGHFSGVAMVIERLFYYINPSKAYFGQKDYQQILVIQQILTQFSLDSELVICEIIRETNGLAMSSRNSRLTDEQLKNAGFLYESLLQLNMDVRTLPLSLAIQNAKKSMSHREGVKIEYLEIADRKTLNALETIDQNSEAIALIAVNYFGVRLLDNLFLS